jgi:hypothetical protein
MADKDGDKIGPQGTSNSYCTDWLRAVCYPQAGHQGPGAQEAPHPVRVSVARKRDNPDGVRRLVESAGKPTVTKAEPPGGKTMVQEANAASRKARGIHNPADRAIPDPKGCRRGPSESTRRTIRRILTRREKVGAIGYRNQAATPATQTA